VLACEDVPTFDDGMIRRALLRSSLICGTVDRLNLAINRELWTIGYAARVLWDPAEHSVLVEVSKSL
jgi:hypothetical protein